MPSIPTFDKLLTACTRSAVHLEMRDTYGTNERFEAWKRGSRVNWDDRASWLHPFNEQISAAVSRGVVIRRARIVSEPASEYIRWEYYVTHANIASGEQVRWLPRRLATDLALPGNDFWCFDDRLVRVHHFSGDGAVVEDELTDDPKVVTLCSSAFEAVWELAIPHEKYHI